MKQGRRGSGDEIIQKIKDEILRRSRFIDNTNGPWNQEYICELMFSLGIVTNDSLKRT